MTEKPDSQLAVQSEQAPSVALMLQSALQQGITKDNADALGKMMELYERMEAKRAEQEFAAAFVALQSEMPQVCAIKGVPNNDGTIRYHYAPFEEVMKQLRGVLTKHKFSLSFDTEVGEGRVTAICKVTHSAGHTKETKYAVRIGSGPPKASEAQADGAAYSYAKRGALCSAFNIVVEKDTDGDDARNLGDFITEKEASDLSDWVDSTNADKAKFLAFACAKTFTEIRSNRLNELHELLRKREQGKK